MHAHCSGGLPAGTTEAEVEREFTKFGTLVTVWVARKPPGFGELSGRAFSARHMTTATILLPEAASHVPSDSSLCFAMCHS